MNDDAVELNVELLIKEIDEDLLKQTKDEEE